MAHLVTGYAGYEHIKAEDDGSFNAAFFGDGQFVMGIGDQFEGSIIDNNTVRILGGDGLMYGRHFRISEPYEDLTITTGTAGTNRIDLICMTYEKNASDETESVRLEVIQGTETTGTAVAPEYTDGNILDGATLNQMPLYKVSIKGVVLTSIEQLFDVIPNYKDLAKMYEEEFKNVCESHLDSLGVLDTYEEIEANTQENQLAGALGVKDAMAQHIAESNPHNITKSDIVGALGYTPPEQDTTYTHPAYTARTGVPTAAQTPAFGGSFSVSQPVSDETGHITALTSRKITIPSTAATTSKAGLMSASDKEKLNGITIVKKTWVDTISGTYIDKTYSSLGLTSGGIYAITINNVNKDASNITVLGASVDEAKSTVRIYWDDSVNSQSCQFAMAAIQIG